MMYVVVRMFLSLNERIQRRIQGGLKEFDSPVSQHFICREREESEEEGRKKSWYYQPPSQKRLLLAAEQAAIR